MLKQKNFETVQDYYDIVLMCEIVSQCRKFPFRAKYDIIGLGEYCKKIIYNEIGPEMDELLAGEDSIRKNISNEYEADILKHMEANPDFKEESIRKMKWPKVAQKINTHEGLKASQAKRQELMKTPCSESVDTVMIPCIEYDEKFGDEAKTAEYLGGMMTRDGMYALVGLISKAVVVLEEPKPQEDSNLE
jgi:hypothetical protein